MLLITICGSSAAGRSDTATSPSSSAIEFALAGMEDQENGQGATPIRVTDSLQSAREVRQTDCYLFRFCSVGAYGICESSIVSYWIRQSLRETDHVIAVHVLVQEELPHYDNDNNHQDDCECYCSRLICLFLLKHLPSMAQTRC